MGMNAKNDFSSEGFRPQSQFFVFEIQIVLSCLVEKHVFAGGVRPQSELSFLENVFCFPIVIFEVGGRFYYPISHAGGVSAV